MLERFVTGHNILYNMGFHPCFIFVFPQMWKWAIPINFVIDTIVYIIGMLTFKVSDKVRKYFTRIILIVIFGFLSDIIGAWIYMGFLAIGLMNSSNITVSFPRNFIFVTVSILLTGGFIFLFNYFVSFAKMDISSKQKIKLALFIAIITMPYLFYADVKNTL